MPIESPCAQVAVGLFLAKKWDFWSKLNTYGLRFCFAPRLGQYRWANQFLGQMNLYWPFYAQ